MTRTACVTLNAPTDASAAGSLSSAVTDSSPATANAGLFTVAYPANPVDYVEDALGNFEAILRQADFTKELQILHIGKWNILRRKQMLLELHGVYAGLWHRALCRSFPDHADAIFDNFIERDARRRPNRKGAQFRERARQYKDMLESTGDQNFTVVSEHLISFSKRDARERKNLGLRLALSLRATYTMIFDRLI